MSKTDQIRQTAAEDYGSDSVVIDEDSAVEWAEGGAWVVARVWVPDAPAGLTAVDRAARLEEEDWGH